MVEDAAELIRGARVLAVVPGLALHVGDVVATKSGAFAQLEFGNGSLVALGPDSALFLLAYPGRPAPRLLPAQFIILQGWLKAESTAGADVERYLSPILEVTKQPGAMVTEVTSAGQRLFVESGTALVATGEARRTPISLDAGQFLNRAGGASAQVANGVPADFVADMPRAFRDTLPHLAQRVAAAEPKIPVLREVSYADVAALLALPVRWRTGFVRRFAGRLHDAAFRNAVEAHLARHPEWDRSLHPERYRAADGMAPRLGRSPHASPDERNPP